MKSRWFSITMYILSFILLFFITSVIIINAYYSIPYNSSGVDLSRSFTVMHDIVFGIVALIFAFLAAYCFLSIFGKKGLKEVFTKDRRISVYISSVLAFGIVYFMTELLVGYIVLNIKDPNSFINGNTGGNITIIEDKTLNNVYLNNSSSNTNMIYIDGKHTLLVNDSNIIHYGNNVLNNRGYNTIINESNGAIFNADRVMLTLTGSNSELAFLNNSTLRLFNSNVSIDNKSSMFIYANKSDIYTNSTSITSSSDHHPIILKNGSNAFFERSNFISENTCDNIVEITSDEDDSVNTLTLKNSSIDKGEYNLFHFDKTKSIINLNDLKIDWSEVEKYIADIKDSDVTINISNSMITGNINFDDNSILKINIEKSQLIGTVNGNKGFELTMDDNSVFTSPGSIHLSKFTGSDVAFRKVISMQNDVKLDTNI